MVSNETILMCCETSVTNAPLCIRHSTQISQSIRWSILKKGKYLLLEITWDDYVLYYILKYIPTYVRMDWPSTTTRPTHTKGAKFFYQTFCGHHPYPYLQYPCFWWYWVPSRKSFIFRVFACKCHADLKKHKLRQKCTFLVKNIL